MIQMEVCANSASSSIAAEEGGAIRVELCDNLYEGGTTPSAGQIKLTRDSVGIQVYPIIRPRGGDFLYSDIEFKIMQEDIRYCRSIGCDGVVIGLLTRGGQIDKQRSATLVDLAYPTKVSYHRAFDMTVDMHQALEDIVDIGCERVLTSGGEANALDGAEMIRRLVTQANGRIEIMPGAGIRTHNVSQVIQVTGATVFHATAQMPVQSSMTYLNERLSMGATTDEYVIKLTDAGQVRELIKNANGF